MLKSLLNSIYREFLNLIYNEKCLICSCAKTQNLLCKNCSKGVHYLSSFPQRFYKEIPIYSMAKYNKTIKTLIHLLKFKHNKTLTIYHFQTRQ